MRRSAASVMLSFDVLVQVALLGELTLAIGALVRLFASVNSHVVLDVT